MMTFTGMRIEENKVFPLGDLLTWEERNALGVDPHKVLHKDVVAIPTGERRRPKRGEWYLSGAKAEAYRARGDFSSAYQIAKLAKIKVVSTYIVERTI